MKNFIRFNLPTGHVFELPTQVIVDDRAATMLAKHPDELKNLDESRADTVGLFGGDDGYNMRDWLLNNMKIDAIMEKHARLVRYTPPDHDWQAAEYSLSEHPSLVADLNGDTLMQTPVELALIGLAARGEVCSAFVLGEAEGQPTGILALIQGTPLECNAFLQGLSTTTNFLAQAKKQTH